MTIENSDFWFHGCRDSLVHWKGSLDNVAFWVLEFGVSVSRAQGFKPSVQGVWVVCGSCRPYPLNPKP